MDVFTDNVKKEAPWCMLFADSVRTRAEEISFHLHFILFSFILQSDIPPFIEYRKCLFLLLLPRLFLIK
jgi:hypothetical protein